MSEKHDFAKHWGLDPQITYLNHGSLGACPLPVLEKQNRLRRHMEAELITFVDRELEDRLRLAREALGGFIGADADDIAFVENATSGVNTVLRSLVFQPGDELITNDHEYNACNNVMRYVAERFGAKVKVARIPFPIETPEHVTAAILSEVTDRTKLVMVSHVTSPTALALPVKQIVDELTARGIDTLVDGAHTQGMLPLDLDALGAAYYTGNCHKWLCTPKGSGFLHVRKDRQDRIVPLAISHGANSRRTDVSRFRSQFDWNGTKDYTPWLCIPTAIEFMDGLLPGGWDALMKRNRAQALAWQNRYCSAMGVAPQAPAEMIGSMVALPLPDGSPQPRAKGFDPLQDKLYFDYRIEIPVIPWPAPPKRLIRFSVQIYNQAEEIDKLTDALQKLL